MFSAFLPCLPNGTKYMCLELQLHNSVSAEFMQLKINFILWKETE